MYDRSEIVVFYGVEWREGSGIVWLDVDLWWLLVVGKNLHLYGNGDVRTWWWWWW